MVHAEVSIISDSYAFHNEKSEGFKVTSIWNSVQYHLSKPKSAFYYCRITLVETNTVSLFSNKQIERTAKKMPTNSIYQLHLHKQIQNKYTMECYLGYWYIKKRKKKDLLFIRELATTLLQTFIICSCNPDLLWKCKVLNVFCTWPWEIYR